MSLKDAVERALKYNLGLLLQEESVKTAHGARWRALAGLLPPRHQPDASDGTRGGDDREVADDEPRDADDNPRRERKRAAEIAVKL